MMITKDNYEIYFLDYLEGNLQVDLVDEFIEFLQQNPELKEELDTFQLLTVPNEDIHLPHKDLLFKTKYDSEKEFNYAAIAMLEDELPADEKENLLNHIEQNPDRKRDLEILKSTFLSADDSITFKNKSQLYKSTSSKKIVLWISRFAAIFILLLVVSSLFTENKIMEAPDALYVKDIDTNEKIEPQKKKEAKEVEEVKPAVKPKETKKDKPKEKKSIREESKGRLTHTGVAEVIIERENFSTPLMIAKTASFQTNISTAYLSDVDQMFDTNIYNSIPESREMLLADRLKAKVGYKGFNFRQITKAGLNLAANISNNKVSYTTREDGTVSAFALETRLLGFSIPNKKRN